MWIFIAILIHTLVYVKSISSANSGNSEAKTFHGAGLFNWGQGFNQKLLALLDALIAKQSKMGLNLPMVKTTNVLSIYLTG